MTEISQALQGMAPIDIASGAGILGIIAGSALTMMFVLRTIFYLVAAIGCYKMFRKAGIAGWKAFIPFYNSYLRYKMAWNPKFFWLDLIVSIIIYAVPTEQELLSLLVFACAIVALVLAIKLALNMAKSFGKSTGWGVLMFFFTSIVCIILGFGSAKYVGNTTVKAEESVTE